MLGAHARLSGVPAHTEPPEGASASTPLYAGVQTWNRLQATPASRDSQRGHSVGPLRSGDRASDGPL